MNLKNFTAKISLKTIPCKYFMKNFLNLCKFFINKSSINRFKLLTYNNIQPQYKMQKKQADTCMYQPVRLCSVGYKSLLRLR